MWSTGNKKAPYCYQTAQVINDGVYAPCICGEITVLLLGCTAQYKPGLKRFLVSAANVN